MMGAGHGCAPVYWLCGGWNVDLLMKERCMMNIDAGALERLGSGMNTWYSRTFNIFCSLVFKPPWKVSCLGHCLVCGKE